MATRRSKRGGSDGFHFDQYLAACGKIEEMEETGNVKELATWKRVRSQSWQALSDEQKKMAHALTHKKKT